MENAYKRQSNNKGFTLLELVVVVLIIGIVASIMIMSLSAMLRANTTRAASSLSSALDKARVDTMSQERGTMEMVIYENDGRYYSCVMKSSGATGSSSYVASSDPNELGSTNISIAAVGGSGSGESVLAAVSSSTSLVVEFKKGTGAIKAVYSTGGVSISGNAVSYSGSSRSQLADCKGFRVSGQKTSTVYVVNNTGRNYIE